MESIVSSPHNRSTTAETQCSNMKLPERRPLTLSQISTSQLRVLAAFSGLESADAERPALLTSLTHELSREAKQQWLVKDAEVDFDTCI